MTYVYPVLTDRIYNYPALKVSLRSLVHQGYPNVVIIGGKPKWLDLDSDKVLWIDYDPQGKNPYVNVMQKIDVAATLLDEFVLMNDDMIFLKPHEVPTDKMYCRNWVYLNHRKLDKPISIFSKSLANTVKAFPKTIDYDTHFPFVVDSKKWFALWQNFNRDDNYQYKSLYGNFHKIPRIPTTDCKIVDIEQLTSGAWDKPIVSTSNTHERVNVFRKFFANQPKSPYENNKT